MKLESRVFSVMFRFSLDGKIEKLVTDMTKLLVN